MENLSSYFIGAAAKRLSAVEVDAGVSNQHEFNGVSKFKEILGSEKITQRPTTFLYLSDTIEQPISCEGFMTWYDSRENHPTRSEFRLYFEDNEAIRNARAGDLMLLAVKQTTSREFIVIIARDGSNALRNVLYLFGIPAAAVAGKISIIDDNALKNRVDSFAIRQILDSISVDIPVTHDDALLEKILIKFNNRFPSTVEFSRFVRDTFVRDFNLVDDPDDGLALLMKREEQMFKLLEGHFLMPQISEGFRQVDDFIKLSLSVQNRRKMRAGSAFENHMEATLRDNGLSFERGVLTEGRSKPDFLFPSSVAYKNDATPAEELDMLALKTTCKDRWRQILNEAARIREKHLATLEPGISKHQLDEMSRHSVKLIAPKSLHDTYVKPAEFGVLTIRDFVLYIKRKQDLAGL
jgi:hypothetical protein